MDTTRTVNLSNKNAFAGANLGVPFSPMEAVTSLDPKDYVWTNPLLNWQLPAAGLAPGHPLGAVPGLPGLMGAPALPQPPFFPGFGAFPWCGLQGLCQRPPVVSATPPVPMVNVGQPQDLLQQPGVSMVPVETPPQVTQKPVEKTTVPLRAMNGFDSVNTSDLLKCCMEDDDLKHLLEDPLDAAFEGLASDSSNASCLTAETASPTPSHDEIEEDFLSLADLNFAHGNKDDTFLDTGGRAAFLEPTKRNKSIPKGGANWGVKKKRSSRRSKVDVKPMNANAFMDTDIEDVALIELGEMLWDMDARALPVGTACLIPEAKGLQETHTPVQAVLSQTET